MGPATSENEVVVPIPLPSDGSLPPSINQNYLAEGASYTYHSALPQLVRDDLAVECVLGVDEAGRGPVLGPMVYGLLYLPTTLQRSLLADAHHFDDSKVLIPEVRARLLCTLCAPDSDLYQACGWATRVMSARDIAAGMLKPASYNLNAQAMDVTIDLIKEVFAKGVNIKEIYIDTIGHPAVYQKKLERIFPTTTIVVAKKADSLYPCVSAASVCAKVTRDVALEELYHPYAATVEGSGESSMEGWGSGYPSDARCTTWLKSHVDPLFGWGPECRFSWATAKELLENEKVGFKIGWPEPGEDEHAVRVTDFFTADAPLGETREASELTAWYGSPCEEQAF